MTPGSCAWQSRVGAGSVRVDSMLFAVCSALGGNYPRSTKEFLKAYEKGNRYCGFATSSRRRFFEYAACQPDVFQSLPPVFRFHVHCASRVHDHMN
jgi:hypothetical protein